MEGSNDAQKVPRHSRPDSAASCEAREQWPLARFIGESQALLDMIAQITRTAIADADVLIMGETGSGKELCARAIHDMSPRSRHDFVAVNCGSLSPELFENELFGHQAGAYTGA